MPYSIDFEHRVSGRTVEEGYRTILAWLQDERAEAKSAQPPQHIEAVHGRAFQIMGWKRDAKKTLSFDLEPAGPDLIVRVRAIPALGNASDVQIMATQARANWNELLADLWMRFGENDALADAVSRPPVDWNDTLRQGWTAIGGGVFLLVLGVAMVAVFLWSSLSYVLVPTGLFAAGALVLIWGAMNVQSAKRGLARQFGPEW